MELPKLKKRQPEILLLLYKFRFLNRRQIQALLGHKDSRRIKSWLSDLTEKEYTGRIYSRKYGELQIPAVYYLEKKSIPYLKEREEVVPKLLSRVYRETKRTERFINHCMLLADLYILFKSVETRKTKLFFFTKTELHGIKYLPDPLPDAYFAVRKSKKNIKRYFLDIFDKENDKFVLRKRVKQYIEYADGEEWEDGSGHPFPIILFVCPNEASNKFLVKYASKEMEEEMTEISFWVTNRDRVSLRKKTTVWDEVAVL